MWTLLPFGKHEGKTLPQVMFSDPDWFFWAYENDAFKSAALKKEAKKIYARSRSILINRDGDWLVEYCFYPGTGKSVGFEIVEKDRAPHEGASPTFRLGLIDMRVPKNQKSYDKLEYKLFLQNLKSHPFGKSNARMNRERCDNFFDDVSNFFNEE